MKPIHVFMSLAMWAVATISFPANAVVYDDLSAPFRIKTVHGLDLEGLVNPGDVVDVYAFYDTGLAEPGVEFPVGPNGETIAKSYDFPVEGAGIRFNVNGLEWKTTGPMSVAVVPIALQEVIGPNGEVGKSWGNIEWNGQTAVQSSYAIPTTIQTPFGMESGSGRFIYYLPHFPTELFDGNTLPTDLSLSDLATEDFISHGVVAGVGPNGSYGFTFANPIPEPETYALMLAGLAILGFRSKRKQALG